MIGKIFKITVNTILVLLVIIGVFVVFSFVPFPGNYRIFTVMSGSMEPTIYTGSMIFVKPEGNYNIGDVVTRRTKDPKVTITHRIIKKEEKDGKTVFDTKGDANSGGDMETIAQSDIIGKEVFKLPYIGYPVGYAKTVPGLILLIVVPAVIIIYDEAQKIKKEILLKMDYRRRTKKREENNLDKSSEEEKKEI